MTVVDQIAAQDRINAGGAFTDYPVTDIDTVLDAQDITSAESIVVTAVNVLDIPDGDYNFDGVVNALDYAIWRDTDGSTTLVQADGNGDGVVDSDDYDIWEAAFGGPGAAAAAGVPEPTAIVLLTIAASVAGLRRRA
ncbi:MAG: PEP-CTERM sorting domain-containing protein, partial [Planctomycetota bacterium]